MGLGRVVLPPVVGVLVDDVGVEAGAWAVTVVVAVAGAVTALLIPEPSPHVDAAATMAD
jgi:hypothetical protein